MKKSLWFAMAVFLAWAPGVAGAQTDGFYLTPKIGLSYFRGDNVITFHERAGTQSFSDRGSKARFAGALAAGYGFSGQGAPVRLELEYAHRSSFKTENSFSYDGRNWVNRADLNIGTLMGNVYWDFENDSAVTPYIGAGLGVAFISGDNKILINNGDEGGFDSSSRKFAWNLNGGAAFALTDNLALDLGYRYFNISNAQTGKALYSSASGSDRIPVNFEVDKIGLHEAMLGLRFSYN